MPALNRVQLISRLGKHPVNKTTPTKRKVTNFSIVIRDLWKSKEGKTNASSEWVNVEAWGSLVFVEGCLKTDRYEDKGEIRYFTKVVTLFIQFLFNRRIGYTLIQ